MLSKTTFLTGMAAGYVLGTRAGRERYDSIARAARGFADTPAVQEAAGVLQAQASTLTDQAKGKVSGKVAETVQHTVDNAAGRVRSTADGQA